MVDSFSPGRPLGQCPLGPTFNVLSVSDTYPGRRVSEGILIRPWWQESASEIKNALYLKGIQPWQKGASCGFGFLPCSSYKKYYSATTAITDRLACKN
jgi:hypothetical protein